MILLKVWGNKAGRNFVQGELFLFRKYCVEPKYTRKWKNNLHLYSYSFNWGSTNELAHILARDVVHNKDGLVIINKPYGIAKEAPVVDKKKVTVENRLSTGLVGERYFYMRELLPLLARMLGYQHLETVKIPERYTSGVTILASSEALAAHVKSCIQKGKNQGKVLHTYRLLCVGSPCPVSFQGKVGVKHEEDKISGGTQPILVRTWSNREIKRQQVITVVVEHSVIEQGQFASLVEIKPSRTKSHFMRFYMAYMLSPILGDNLYGSRVQKIGSQCVAISPFSDRAKMPQRLEDQVLQILDLKRREESFIPAHIHLHSVTIPDFERKGESLYIEVPPPEYFQWSCKRLLQSGIRNNEKAEVEC